MEYLLFWGFGLIGLGVLLTVIDIFVPTAGVLSLTALAISIAGAACLWNHSAMFGLIGTALIVFGGPTLFFVGLNLMPHTPLGRKLVLGAEDPGADRAPPAPDPMLALIGQEGVVTTDLRPVGTVRIDNMKYDALAESTLIRAGERVRVVSIADGGTVKVRPIA